MGDDDRPGGIHADPLVGTVLDGRFEIQAVIGRGGMGTVYRGQQMDLDRLVAIKVLNKELCANEATVKRFTQEARILHKIRHRHLVESYAIGVTGDGRLYLVMEYIAGRSLAQVLAEQSPLPPGRVAAIVVQTCQALACVHKNDVIHRDLKPDNILLLQRDGEDDFVKVVDFGIARMIEDDRGNAQKLTQTGTLIGSPLYMSPEQCLGSGLDARSDVYSLGCVMYELMTGRAPFTGDSPLDTLYKHLHEPASTPPQRLQLPAGLVEVTMRALEKSASNRFQSMPEMEAALSELSKGKGIGGSRRRRGRSWRLAAWLAAGVLVGLGLIAVGKHYFFAGAHGAGADRALAGYVPTDVELREAGRLAKEAREALFSAMLQDKDPGWPRVRDKCNQALTYCLNRGIYNEETVGIYNSLTRCLLSQRQYQEAGKQAADALAMIERHRITVQPVGVAEFVMAKSLDQAARGQLARSDATFAEGCAFLKRARSQKARLCVLQLHCDGLHKLGLRDLKVRDLEYMMSDPHIDDQRLFTVPLDLACEYIHLNKMAEARKTYQRALAIARKAKSEAIANAEMAADGEQKQLLNNHRHAVDMVLGVWLQNLVAELKYQDAIEAGKLYLQMLVAENAYWQAIDTCKLSLSKAYLGTGRVKEAAALRQQVERSLALPGHDNLVLHFQVMVAEYNEAVFLAQIDRQARVLDRLIAQSARFSEPAYLSLFDLLTRHLHDVVEKGQYERAIVYATSACRRLLTERPHDKLAVMRTHGLLSELYTKLGNPDDAALELAATLAELPAGSRDPAVQKWRLHFLPQQARQDLGKKQLGAADEAFHECLMLVRKNPDCGSTLVLSGLLSDIASLRQEQGQPSRALRCYRNLEKTVAKLPSPLRREGIFLLLQAAMQLELFADAEQHLHEFAKMPLPPNVPESPARLPAIRGQLALKRKHFAAAQKYYQEAASIALAGSGKHSGEYTQCLFHLGLIAKSERDYKKAEKYYLEAMALSGEGRQFYRLHKATYRQSLAELYDAMGQPAKAEAAREAMRQYEGPTVTPFSIQAK